MSGHDAVSAVRRALRDPVELSRKLGLLAGKHRRQAGGVSILCPWHNERDPSCSVTVGADGTVRARCMSCGATGDALHLIAAAKHLDIKTDFVGVLDAAAAVAGVDISSYRASGLKPKTIEASYYFRRISEVILEWQPLQNDHEACEYLRGRGLLDGALSDGWGALPPTVAGRATLLRLLCKAFGDDHVVESGVAYRDKGGAVRWLWEEARLCIPYLRGGVVVGLQRRAPSSKEIEGGPKYVWAGVPGIVYNEDEARSLIPAPLAFVEGAADAVALRKLAGLRGLELVALGVPGSAWDGAVKRLPVAGRVCYVATDNEQGVDAKGVLLAGERYAVDWAADLYAAGAIEVVRLRPMGAKDWAAIAEQIRDGDPGGEFWETEPIPRTVAPDGAWQMVAELAGAVAARGTAPELDIADVSRLEQALAEIKRRVATKPSIEFVDRAELAGPVDFGEYPIMGLPMLPGPPTLFVAYSFSGKTIVLQDALLALALGERVWGEFDCQPSRVVHLDYEQGRRETIDRYHRLLRGRLLPHSLLADIRLDIAIRPNTHLWSTGAADDFAKAVDRASVCLIDTFGAASPNQDENDARIAEGLHMLTEVSERTGCVFIVAHHIGKAGASSASSGRGKYDPDPRTLARGHGAIFGAAGYCYHLGGKPREPKQCSSIKGRNLGDPPIDDFWLRLSTVDVRDADPARGWDGYKNPRNPGDHGGFSVRYMCEEEYVRSVADRIDVPARGASKPADPAACLDFIRRRAAEGSPVVSAEVVASALGVSKSSAADAIKAHLVSGAIRRTKVANVNCLVPA